MNKVIVNRILMAVGAVTIAGFITDKLKARRKKRDYSNFKTGYLKGYTDAATIACDWFADYTKKDDSKKGK